MEQSPSDIIQQANDILTSDDAYVVVFTKDMSIIRGTLTGLASQGDLATITVDPFPNRHVLIDVSSIIYITQEG